MHEGFLDLCLIFNKPNPQSIQLNILQTLRPKRYFKQQCPMNTLLSYVLNILFVFSTLTTSEASGEKNNLPLPFPISFVSYKWYDNMGGENPKRNENNGEYQPPLCPNNDQLTRKYYCDKSRVSTLSATDHERAKKILDETAKRGPTCAKIAEVGYYMLATNVIVTVPQINPKELPPEYKHYENVWGFSYKGTHAFFDEITGKVLGVNAGFLTLDARVLQGNGIENIIPNKTFTFEWLLIHELDHIFTGNPGHVALDPTGHENLYTDNTRACAPSSRTNAYQTSL